ncbi:MAG: TlyA family RNA methyltransferase [Alicyclobacillus sp.]|nr:TlyA family RNA methyltransferase [Alicyclobacillus sp.]
MAGARQSQPPERGKVRLDVLLFQRGLFPSREAARRAIMAGLVRRRDGERLDKPGLLVPSNEAVEVMAPEHTFVSRGGLKLARALDRFAVQVQDRVAVDVGASTGGFTDCLLQRGARLVYAVDVGYGQLAWKLRTDPRVRVMERTNFRYIKPAQFDPRPTLATVDVSFISLRLLFLPLTALLGPDGDVVTLVKPQFEAGREAVGKGGIVRDPAVHRSVLARVIHEAAAAGLRCLGLTYSPIAGGDGNLEFLAHWRIQATAQERPVEVSDADIATVVAQAWTELGRSSGTRVE